MKFDVGIMFDNIVKFLPYILVTFEYVLLSLLFGGVLAFALAAAKLGKNKVLKFIANAYTTVLRCLPSITVLFVVFYIIPALTRIYLGVNIDGISTIVFVIITFTLFLGASLSELMRGAYLSVDKDQFDAALSIGMTHFQGFRRIILPQAFYYSIPNLGNTVIFLLKEGALGYTVGLLDMMGKAYVLNSTSQSMYAIEIYAGLTLVYWPLAILIERLFKLLERKFTLQKTDKSPGKRLKRAPKGAVYET